MSEAMRNCRFITNRDRLTAKTPIEGMVGQDFFDMAALPASYFDTKSPNALGSSTIPPGHGVN
jgi:hypothetical protein